jgi:UDP-N-acetylmuramyl tripeptide synthase
MQKGVCSLVPTADDSRGRSNWLRYNNADIFIDFAHNPDGIRRVVEMGLQWSAKRKAIVLGQAGDRLDEEIKGIGYQAAALNADMYFLKELPGHSYGRKASEVVDLLSNALLEKGVQPAQIAIAKSDLESAQMAMNWVHKEDLLILLSHEQLDEVMEMVMSRGATWGYRD